MSDDNTGTQGQDENLGTTRAMTDETASGVRGERLGTGTAQIMEHIEHHRTTADPLSPLPGEHDPRDVDLPDLQIPLLGPAIDAIVDSWAPAGSPLHSLRERFQWGIVNTLYSQTKNLEYQLDRVALDLRELTADSTPAGEVSENALEEASTNANRLYDRLGALERLHHPATIHYHQRTGKPWRPNTRRSYVATQEPYEGTYSTGRDVAQATRLERDLAAARTEQEAESRARAIARAREDNPTPTPYEDGPYVPPPPVPENAYHVVVVGDRDYAHYREVSNALERLHTKHPNLVVNALSGTDMGDFAREWADLHGVPSRAIGASPLYERPDLSSHRAPTGEAIPSHDDPSREIPLYEHVPTLEHPTTRQIARREGAILDLAPRVVMSFGNHRYESRPYIELAAGHNLPLWAFDNEGQGTAYQGDQAPAPDERVRNTAPVYAGIGARETPDHIQELMRETAQYLAEEQYTLRSGAARGADQAFETGADLSDGAKTIFIPEDGFRGRRDGLNGATADIPDLAFTIAAEQHRNWNALKDDTRRLHARNSLQVLGLNLDQPADVVICWTRDGAERGGTGQAIRLAKAHNVPIINLGAEGAPTTPDELFEKVRETVLPWTPGELDQGIDSERSIAPPAPAPIPEYDADAIATFEHSDATLHHANQNLDRFLHVVGPEGTQLSDYRAGVAWGLVNVVNYQNNKSAERFERAIGTPDYERAGREYSGLNTLKTGLARHYSADLRLGPWTERGRRPNPGQTYAQVQAKAFLAKRAQTAIEKHRIDHARILVDGSENLTFEHYDRLDKLLKNVRQWHLDNEGRDVVIVHKSPQSILRSWAENNSIHQHIYQPNFRRYAKQAPARRDHDMVHQHPPDRYIHIDTPEAKNFTQRHVVNYNASAREKGRNPIRIQHAVPTTALDASKDSNVVALRPAVEPLRFNSRSNEGQTLSNFANTPLQVDGLQWQSVEHYYQAAKLGAIRDPKAESAWAEIRDTPTPGRTKQLGGKLKLVPDWNTRKLGTMAEALCLKFAPGNRAAEELLATGNRPLIHETHWGQNGDPFWGSGRDGKGANRLGQMLENAREHLRGGQAPILDKLLEPQGIQITDPAEARVGDYLAAHQRYEESYNAWTETFYGAEPGVADKRAAETAAHGTALSRATATFLDNFERYEPYFAAEEFSRGDLEKYNRMYQPQEQKTQQQQIEQTGELRP